MRDLSTIAHYRLWGGRESGVRMDRDVGGVRMDRSHAFGEIEGGFGILADQHR